MPNRAMYANLVEFQIKFYLHYLLQFLRPNRELISQKHKLLFRSKVMKEEQVAFSFESMPFSIKWHHSLIYKEGRVKVYWVTYHYVNITTMPGRKP